MDCRRAEAEMAPRAKLSLHFKYRLPDYVGKSVTLKTIVTLKTLKLKHVE